jgi:hypothetical protein
VEWREGGEKRREGGRGTVVEGRVGMRPSKEEEEGEEKREGCRRGDGGCRCVCATRLFTLLLSLPTPLSPSDDEEGPLDVLLGLRISGN